MMFVFWVLWFSAVAINGIHGELECEDPASLLQRGDIHDKVNMTTMVEAQVAKNIIDMEPVLQCLRLTTPNIQTLKYPKDAEKHFEKLQEVLAPYVQVAKNRFHGRSCSEGFCGPWIEDRWLEHFMSTWQNRTSGKDATKRLAEVFGPFIPIFVPYNDLGRTSAGEYAKMIDTLQKSLRPDVAYITLANILFGLINPPPEKSLLQYERMLHIMKTFPNVVVLGPGGYGHVPIPHLKQPEELLQKPFFKPMAKRDLLVSFMGRYETNSLRKKMKKIVEEEAKTLGVKVDMHVEFEANDVWHQVAGNSKVSLCPRGSGRTSYRLFEILQLGLIPVHVYWDIPWLPYPDLYKNIGFSTDLEGLPNLLKKINDMDLQELERMEERIRSFKATHFTYEGVLNQISLFMKNGGSDLRCQKLPDGYK